MARIRQNKPIRRSTNASQAKQVNDLYKSHSQLWNKVKRIGEEIDKVSGLVDTSNDITVDQIVQYLKQVKVSINDLEDQKHFQKHSLHAATDHEDVEGTPIDGSILVYDDDDDVWEFAEPGPPRYWVTFTNNGVLSNDWMGATELVTEGRLFATKSEMVALAITNSTSDRDIDIEIYKNGTTAGFLEYTWELRDFQSASLQLATPIVFDVDDVLHIYARRVGSSTPRYVTLDITMEAIIYG